MTRFAAVAALLAGLSATSATAAPITFAFTGTVTFVAALDPANPFPTEPTFGTPFSGVYTFDSAAGDAIPADPTTGSYESSGGVYKLALKLGGLSFSYSAVSIGVTDGYSTFGGGDQYLVGFADGPTVVSLRFTDLAEAMFAGDALPLTPPSLTGLFTELFFTEIVSGNQVDLGGTIDSLRVRVVPEPSTVLLLGSAAAAFGIRRRQRR